MFSGIIVDVGTIKKVAYQKNLMKLNISSCLSHQLSLGESICVNGACLTVTLMNSNEFTVELSQTTLQTTHFKSIKEGDLVNLERALRVSDRLSGHIVSGHIDCTAKILEWNTSDPALYKLVIQVPLNHEHYLIAKGSITINGVSLTIVSVQKGVVDVTIIPHTFENTTFKTAQRGDICNIEVDLTGKYIESVLNSWKSKFE